MVKVNPLPSGAYNTQPTTDNLMKDLDFELRCGSMPENFIVFLIQLYQVCPQLTSPARLTNCHKTPEHTH